MTLPYALQARILFILEDANQTTSRQVSGRLQARQLFVRPPTKQALQKWLKKVRPMVFTINFRVLKVKYIYH
jgi:hypothetical protein